MSWSVSSIGKVPAVKAQLVTQFASAKDCTKNVPAECEAVGMAEQLVNRALEFLSTVQTPPIKVTGGGSAYTMAARDATPAQGAFTFKLEIEQLWGFVE
jgi:hypothetical protein